MLTMDSCFEADFELEAAPSLGLACADVVCRALVLAELGARAGFLPPAFVGRFDVDRCLLVAMWPSLHRYDSIMGCH
jgi:hypothetical protein